MGAHSIRRPHQKLLVIAGQRRPARPERVAPAMLGAFTIAAVLTAFAAGTAAAGTIAVPTTVPIVDTAQIRTAAAVEVPGIDARIAVVCDGGNRIYYTPTPNPGGVVTAIAVTLDRNGCP